MSVRALPLPADHVGLPPSVEEELEMTFQVATVGKGGVIVGSDRKISVKGPQVGLDPNLQYVPGDKFIKRDDDSVICFYAGMSRSKSIAHAVVHRANPAELDRSRWEHSLTAIADSCHAENSSGDEVLVIRKDVPDVILLSMERRPGDAAQTTKIEEKMCTGVPAPARFVAHHFWKDASVAALETLALLTLGYAAREHPGSVGFGFDVVSITDGHAEWKRYTPDDELIASLCQSFERAALAVIYDSNFRIE